MTRDKTKYPKTKFIINLVLLKSYIKNKNNKWKKYIR